MEIPWRDADVHRALAPIAGGRLDIRIDDFPGVEVVVRVAGEIDTLTEAHFAAELIGACVRADRQRVVVDLALVDFLGAAGLRVLMELCRLCRRWRLDSTIRNPSPAALRSIELGGFGIPRQGSGQGMQAS